MSTAIKSFHDLEVYQRGMALLKPIHDAVLGFPDYEKFDLASRDISFDAFYRYARRLREAARLQYIEELTADEAAATTQKAIPQLVANQLADCLLTENPSSRTVARLANAYRHFVTAQVARRRLDFAELDHKETERSREITEITDAYIRINKLKLADIQGDLALQRTAGSAPPPDPQSSQSPSIPESLSPSIPRSASLKSAQSAVPTQNHSAAPKARPDRTASPSFPYSLNPSIPIQSIDSRIDAAIDARLPPTLRSKKKRPAAPT